MRNDPGHGFSQEGRKKSTGQRQPGRLDQVVPREAAKAWKKLLRKPQIRFAKSLPARVAGMAMRNSEAILDNEPKRGSSSFWYVQKYEHKREPKRYRNDPRSTVPQGIVTNSIL